MFPCRIKVVQSVHCTLFVSFCCIYHCNIGMGLLFPSLPLSGSDAHCKPPPQKKIAKTPRNREFAIKRQRGEVLSILSQTWKMDSCIRWQSCFPPSINSYSQCFERTYRLNQMFPGPQMQHATENTLSACLLVNLISLILKEITKSRFSFFSEGRNGKHSKDLQVAHLWGFLRIITGNNHRQRKHYLTANLHSELSDMMNTLPELNRSHPHLQQLKCGFFHLPSNFHIHIRKFLLLKILLCVQKKRVTAVPEHKHSQNGLEWCGKRFSRLVESASLPGLQHKGRD